MIMLIDIEITWSSAFSPHRPHSHRHTNPHKAWGGRYPRRPTLMQNQGSIMVRIPRLVRPVADTDVGYQRADAHPQIVA